MKPRAAQTLWRSHFPLTTPFGILPALLAQTDKAEDLVYNAHLDDKGDSYERARRQDC